MRPFGAFLLSWRHIMKYEWFKIAIISGTLILGVGSYWITKRADGPVEQFAESVLRAHGVDIDISPEE